MAVVLGAGLGVVYDCFRVIRIVFPPAKKTGAVNASDVIFCLIYGFSIFFYSVMLGRGEVRLFYFAGSVLGFALYIFSIGSVVTGIIRAITTTAVKIIKRIFSPAAEFLSVLRQKITPVFVKTSENKSKRKNNSSKRLKIRRGLLYNRRSKKGTGKGGRGIERSI